MLSQALHFVATTAEHTEPGLFGALGIDWQLLLLQGLAFLILVALLGKFVYPKLIAAIDAREQTISESVAAATKAEAKAEQAQVEVKALLAEARKEASDIVATAKKEATASVEAAEEKALKRAAHIITEAEAQLEKDITKARAELRKETAELVAMATEKIIGEKLDATRDAKLIDTALKGAK